MVSMALSSDAESDTGSAGASAFLARASFFTAFSGARLARGMLAAEAFAGSMSEPSPVRSIIREFIDFVSQCDFQLMQSSVWKVAEFGGKFGGREVNKSRQPLTSILLAVT